MHELAVRSFGDGYEAILAAAVVSAAPAAALNRMLVGAADIALIQRQGNAGVSFAEPAE